METLALNSWAASLLRHLWQSTVFTAGVWLLTLALRRNAAWLRYRLWMIASLKFLLPLSLLIAAGARLAPLAHVERAQPKIATVVEGVSQPLLQAWPADATANFTLAGAAAGRAAAHTSTDWLPLLLLGVWAAGTMLLLGRWMRSWLALRAAVRCGEPITLAAGTRALLTAESVEPGIVGIMRPVLVLPRGIAERLSAEQLDAIVAHELSHMRRRDNLTAALHMAVEAVFWFHPLVWWLGARLVEERERACDEAVLEGSRQPMAYAEGILNICKFYVEVPLSCVSGVTGSELKRRIARILSGQSARKLDPWREALLGLAGILALGMPLALGAVRNLRGPIQAAVEATPEHGGIAGTWQGTTHTPDGHNLRVVLKIEKDAQGKLSATYYNLDQNGPPMAAIAANSVSFEGGTLRLTNNFPGLTYEGKISADGNSISGTVTQMASMPLVLERATPDTEWALPAPPPKIPAMAPDAHPAFEVATIKPAPPDAQRAMFRMRGGELVVENQSLSDLIRFAYDVEDKQIAEGPGWMGTDKWDINAKPDTPGMPSQAQTREMLQKLLAERFSLKVHEEKRQMAAYALTVSKDGPKLTKSAVTSEFPGFTMGPLGVMHAGRATMGDFAHILQGGILDRPVLDETGLSGQWDFTLKWTPDETQFAGLPVRPPSPPADDASPLPPLFTAIQEQLGLKLEGQKADVPVVVIDHVDHPSPN
jgi:uncharacterized protein (TIGR03435 family)